MDCRYFKELISLYLDGYAKEEEISEMEKHLSQCEDCNNYFLRLKSSTEIIRGMEKVEAPRNFEKKVMEKIEKNQKIFKGFFAKKIILEISAALVVLFSIMVIYLNLNQPEKEMEKISVLEDKIQKEDVKKIEKDKLPLGDSGSMYKTGQVQKKEEKKQLPDMEKEKIYESAERAPQAKPLLEPPVENIPLVEEKEQYVAPAVADEVRREKFKIEIKKEDFLEVSKKIEEFFLKENISYAKKDVNENNIEFSISFKDMSLFLKEFSKFENIKMGSYEIKEKDPNKKVILQLSVQK